MLKSLMVCIELMGEEMTPAQQENTMKKIKQHCSVREIEQLIIIADEEKSPIHEQLIKYSQNMGYAGYY